MNLRRVLLNYYSTDLGLKINFFSHLKLKKNYGNWVSLNLSQSNYTYLILSACAPDKKYICCVVLWHKTTKISGELSRLVHGP